MTVYIRWLTCECGKRHAAVGIGPASVCTCDRKLWPQMFNPKPGVPSLSTKETEK